MMNDIIEALQDKDNKKAYALSGEIEAASAASDVYYSYFSGFAGLLASKSSYVRTRGFVFCCAQAKWDDSGKLAAAMPAMLALLHDEKPTAVRRCLAALHEVVLYRPELCEAIESEVKTIDLSKYRDSMSPLIKKDMDELLRMTE